MPLTAMGYPLSMLIVSREREKSSGKSFPALDKRAVIGYNPSVAMTGRSTEYARLREGTVGVSPC